MKRVMLLVMAGLLAMQVRGQLQAGVAAGLNLASMSFSDAAYKTGIRPGLSAGVWINKKVTERLALQLEARYSQEGATEKLGSPGLEGKIRSAYLQLPLETMDFLQEAQ